jgi:GntR family transcriptional regulator
LLNLNYRDSKPIYLQIKEQLRDLIVSGTLEAGERLPSVREIATQLAINPNTIQRAYRELEYEGYTYSVPGKGNFAGGRSDIGAERKKILLKELGKIVSELMFLGMSVDEIAEKIKTGGEAL